MTQGRETLPAARALLEDCLWDDEPWDATRLVSQMEAVYVALGGSLSGPRVSEASAGTEGELLSGGLPNGQVGPDAECRQ